MRNQIIKNAPLPIKYWKLRSIGLVDSTIKAQIQKNQTNLNWECMARSMNIERLRFALGDLKPEDCLDYYEPSGFHKYKGVGEELSKLVLT